MGFKNEYKKALKYSMAVGGAMIAGPAGAKAGYDLGSTFDPRKTPLQGGLGLKKHLYLGVKSKKMIHF